MGTFSTHDSSRGQSGVLATVLLLGIVLVVVGAVVAVGAAAIDDSRSQASMTAATSEMSEMDAQLSQIASREGGSGDVTLPDAGNGDRRIQQTGSITVTTTTEDDSGNLVSSTRDVSSLGSVVYENDDQRLIYQSGAVWRASGDSDDLSLVSAPPLDYYNRDDYKPTVRFSAVKVEPEEGRADGSAATTGTTRLIPAGSMPLASEDETIEITIESKYYEGWFDYFKQVGPDNQVSKSSPPAGSEIGTATVWWEGPGTGSTTLSTGAIVAPYSSGTGANDGAIRSYDSSQSSTSIQDSGAPVIIKDDYNPSNDISIGGDLWVGDHLTLSNQVEVQESAFVIGDASIEGDSGDDQYFGESLEVNGNLEKFSTDAEVEENLIVGEAVGSDSAISGTVGGQLHAGGSSSSPVTVAIDGATIGEAIIVDGTVILRSDYSGPKIVARNVEIEGPGTSVNTIIHATNSVTIDSGVNSVEGEIRAPTIGGSGSHSATVSSDPPETPDPMEPEDEIRPLDDPSPMTDRINDAEPDSSVDGHPGIEGDSPGQCNEARNGGQGCILGESEYKLDEINLNNDNQRAVIDTSDGPVKLWVDGPVTVTQGARLVVEGSNPVEIYSTTAGSRALKVTNGGKVLVDSNPATDIDLSMNSADLSNSGYTRLSDANAALLTTYVKPDAEVYFSGPDDDDVEDLTTFTGVVKGPGSSSNEGAKVSFSQTVLVYGSIIGHIDQMSNNARLRYDRRLQDRTVIPIDPDDNGRVRYGEGTAATVAIGT